jgi:ATPase subunit of ABC transporter with duplicated ATPase domains
LIFISHDRSFVASLATRIIELSPLGIVDYRGNYEDYLLQQTSGRGARMVSGA